MNALINWIDDRTGLKKLMHEALYEHIPGGARWRYVWGSTLVYTFTIQVITGIFLATAYSPSTTTAWESVYHIQNHMQFGWLVRGMHHFSAQAMTVLLAIHLMQVVIDGAYKAPREVNFWLGLILMQIVLGLGLTGYLLPWDQKGYYATQVSTEIMGATPVVGPQLQQIAQGGPQYGHHTLTRFFTMHVMILPGTLVAFLVLHIAVFRRHGITVPDPDRAPGVAFWPDQVLKDAVACLVVLATVVGLAYWKGAELSAPADPSEAFSAARPEWYFLFLFQFLRFEWVEHQGLAFGAIYLPGALMLLLTAMPIFGRWKLGHWFNIVFMMAMMVGIIGLTGLALKNDAKDPDFQAAVKQAHDDSERIKVLAERPDGIPLEGAVSLLRNDPLTQGPRLFARNCAMCHRYNGHDGTGREVVKLVNKERIPELPTATDLGKFGTKDWLKSVITDYATTFAPLSNAREEVKKHFGTDSEMAGWSKSHSQHWRIGANEASLEDLTSFLQAQGGRTSPKPNIDEAAVKRGREIFTSGKLAVGEFESKCTDCHSLKPRGEEAVFGEGGTAPTLTGYAGSDWLREFLKNPGHSQFYGDHNAMPAFGDRLSEKELDLLVRWMVGDFE
ncbi:MAG: cytochrome b N-terminal domain-containing protein [Planctomycetia bacterium]|nr:cytochrome b N-terminal domain-containing protein [Planctomycetia bacterium]